MADSMDHIRVVHYGPKFVEDFDHTSSVMITRTNRMGGKMTQVVWLENDAELNDLIRKLQAARWEGDSVDGAQRT